MDTVGAVCMDTHGQLCAGVSSGGVVYKTPGRIGQVSDYSIYIQISSFFSLSHTLEVMNVPSFSKHLQFNTKHSFK